MDGGCIVCGCDPREAKDPLHLNSALHRFNFKLYGWDRYRKALVKNRHGVELSVTPIPLNGFQNNFQTNVKSGQHILTISPTELNMHRGKLEFICKVKNTRRDDIIITSADVLVPYTLFSMHDPQHNLESGIMPRLRPGATYDVIVRFQITEMVFGRFKIPIDFSIQTSEDPEKADTFSIARSVMVAIEEGIIEEIVNEESPFKGEEWPKDIGLVRPKKTNYGDTYKIPERYYLNVKYGLKELRGVENLESLQEIRSLLQPGYITPNNYKDFFHIMLWLEEISQVLMLQRYNMKNVNLKLKSGGIFELNVPGLAEKRPSVILGDMIDLRIQGDHKAFRGVISGVTDKTVLIKYVEDELIDYFEMEPTLEIDVRFVLGRLALERMHQGVDLVVINQLVPRLFPSPNLAQQQVPRTVQISNHYFFNKTILDNNEQKTAVLNILNQTSRTAPYIVYGPPGTGKTVTIVEAILQMKRLTKKRILVCAPANAACDMLTQKLAPHCQKGELIRVLSDTVDTSSISPEILKYTNLNEDKVFAKIPPHELNTKYRIVVTTLILVGRYSRKYHPDVVFIDEAAQAGEPETDCAIGLLKHESQIVLAGDPNQLGPNSQSKVSRDHGLDKSLLERLMDMDLYKSHNPDFITMLILNFRSHPKILHIPNESFYMGRLQPVSVSAIQDPISKTFVYKHITSLASNIKKKNRNHGTTGMPIEFCSVLAKERREGKSPSYFNPSEIKMVEKYVEALTSLDFGDEKHEVLPSQIGVVTPYIRQVYKVRECLRERFPEVEIGTTETFQGREKRIIIITTVRAQEDLLLFDKKYNLGFVKHDKRFNVAMTRAMSKLIVIGNPLVLGTDDKWLRYIEMCESHNAFCGAPYLRRTQEVTDEIIRRMDNIKMVDSQYLESRQN